MVNLIQAGKTFLQGLLLAAACATTPPFQAKRDYAVYPDYRGDIAFYNIEHILKDNCKDGQAFMYESGFSCIIPGVCLRLTQVPIQYRSDGSQSGGYYTCSENTEDRSISYSWKDITSVAVQNKCLRINGPINSSQDCELWTKSPAQAQELAEAIGIYVEELRKK